MTADPCPLEPTRILRLSYGEDVLDVPDDCTDDTGTAVWWSALELPDFPGRYEYAPPSKWRAGQSLLAAVRDSAEVGASLVLRAGSYAAMVVLQAQVEAQLWTRGTVELVYVDGAEEVTVAGPWRAVPATPAWGLIEPTDDGNLICQGGVTIPVNPPEAP